PVSSGAGNRREQGEPEYERRGPHERAHRENGNRWLKRRGRPPFKGRPPHMCGGPGGRMRPPVDRHMCRSEGNVELVHQRYQCRRPAVLAPPTNQPISHKITAAIRIHHRMWTANPSPPNTTSSSNKTINATM